MPGGGRGESGPTLCVGGRTRSAAGSLRLGPPTRHLHIAGYRAGLAATATTTRR